MAKPFFKWAGGKASLIPQLLPLLPADYAERRHVEPFLGGGALFFATEPKEALLADVNHSLVQTYRIVAQDPEYVIRSLKRLLRRHSKDEFYRLRQRFNHSPLYGLRERAPLFLYLNKTCFNGLYRENKKGEFNVPVGDYKELSVDAETIRIASAALSKAIQIRKTGYVGLYLALRSSDFVYFDPPYHGGFTAYVKDGFDESDQCELADFFKRCGGYGTKLMLSNSDTPLIRKLYKGFNITRLDAPRAIAADGGKRNKVSELVIRNYE